MYIHADTLRRAWCDKSEKRRPPVAHVSHHSAAPLRTARRLDACILKMRTLSSFWGGVHRAGPEERAPTVLLTVDSYRRWPSPIMLTARSRKVKVAPCKPASRLAGDVRPSCKLRFGASERPLLRARGEPASCETLRPASRACTPNHATSAPRA